MDSGNLQRVAFEYITERNQIIRDVSSEMGMRLVDLYAEFDTECRDDFRDEFLDIVHLRPSAYPKIARLVYQATKDLLPASCLCGETGTASRATAILDAAAEAVDLGGLFR